VSRRLRRGASLAVVATAAASALVLAAAAVAVSLRVIEYARGHRRESFAAAQDRVLGERYMAAIREIRAATPPDATLYLVDATPRESGAPYFALHYLAPRRVVLLGVPRSERPNLIRSRLPRDARWVVVVPGEGEPLRLRDADHFRPRSRRRGH
jgi:hypothetical protein